MKSLDLSLRQKRILYILQHSDSTMTSAELAHQLNVSSRTIRNDITKINEEITPYNAQILSLKSKGYQFEAENMEQIEALNQIETAFFTKENRARYLAFKLCLADAPLNLYDLEDEMFISYTTLDHTLRDLARQWTDHYPHIAIIRKRKNIMFEEDEAKRRNLLVEMLRESWNYHSRRNAYYNDDFIDPADLDFIIDLVSNVLAKYKIPLEDPCIVSLNLMLAVMCYRVKSGHILPYHPPIPKSQTKVYSATKEILGEIERELEVYIYPEDMDSIYLFIASHEMVNLDEIERSQVADYYGPITRQMVDRYLLIIENYFGLDLSTDDDFYIALLQYVRALQRKSLIYNEQFALDPVKIDLRIELIIANLFQDLAKKYLDGPLSETQLIYLAYNICGALETFVNNHPGDKLKTVLCCQMNMPFLFAMKRRLESNFGNHLDITSLIPVNQKDAFNFKNTDLVLTTAKKEISNTPNTDVVYISTMMTKEDKETLEQVILRRAIRKIYTAKLSVTDLFQNAFYHERNDANSLKEVYTIMAEDFRSRGYVDDSFLTDILERESISTYINTPGVAYIYSTVPAEKSAMSILTLDHRITSNSHKVRIFIMTCLTLEDMPIMFRMSNLLYDEAVNLKHLKMKKDIDEIVDFYLSELETPLNV